eukprot:TRINITY_DN91525_c0_g1_i1.p1 TRINITY_DN91525_c0_g1~~TRINITY_DN91525_c0_g1_i1.p1  ORF type:complete len:302 (-),score=90.56 TRINITY_DN91525_c0_g1_i1:183-1088(-)
MTRWPMAKARRRRVCLVCTAFALFAASCSLQAACKLSTAFSLSALFGSEDRGSKGDASQTASSNVQRRLPLLASALGASSTLLATQQARADDLDFLGEIATDDTAKPIKRVTGKFHDQVVEASQALHSFQKNWASLEASGAEGAEKILDLLSGTVVLELSMEVKPEFDLGAEVENRRVVKVVDEKSPLKKGDLITKLNGEQLENQQQFVDTSKSLKEKGEMRYYTYDRSISSPFVTLQKACGAIFVDADQRVKLPEPPEVTKLASSLKFETGLVKDGIMTFKDIRASLDKLAFEVDKYAEA